MEALCQNELGMQWTVEPDMVSRQCQFTMGAQAAPACSDAALDW